MARFKDRRDEFPTMQWMDKVLEFWRGGDAPRWREVFGDEDPETKPARMHDKAVDTYKRLAGDCELRVTSDSEIFRRGMFLALQAMPVAMKRPEWWMYDDSRKRRGEALMRTCVGGMNIVLQRKKLKSFGFPSMNYMITLSEEEQKLTSLVPCGVHVLQSRFGYRMRMLWLNRIIEHSNTYLEQDRDGTIVEFPQTEYTPLFAGRSAVDVHEGDYYTIPSGGANATMEARLPRWRDIYSWFHATTTNLVVLPYGRENHEEGKKVPPHFYDTMVRAWHHAAEKMKIA